ncbi:unnamed protein product [Staurois parvus]|uniref:Uncharacterized protein n=1 Tax=Staurois parvus TaxID=386267 RepID=A0ABN9CYK6_9NEOB|nr:unnamed protein product [Staurois parvus]
MVSSDMVLCMEFTSPKRMKEVCDRDVWYLDRKTFPLTLSRTPTPVAGTNDYDFNLIL